jgi:hypothetical protein
MNKNVIFSQKGEQEGKTRPVWWYMPLIGGRI